MTHVATVIESFIVRHLEGFTGPEKADWPNCAQASAGDETGEISRDTFTYRHHIPWG